MATPLLNPPRVRIKDVVLTLVIVRRGFQKRYLDYVEHLWCVPALIPVLNERNFRRITRAYGPNPGAEFSIVQDLDAGDAATTRFIGIGEANNAFDEAHLTPNHLGKLLP